MQTNLKISMKRFEKERYDAGIIKDITPEVQCSVKVICKIPRPFDVSNIFAVVILSADLFPTADNF